MNNFNLTFSQALELMAKGATCEMQFDLCNIKFTTKGDKLFYCRAESKDKSVWIKSGFDEKFLDGKWRKVEEE